MSLQEKVQAGFQRIATEINTIKSNSNGTGGTSFLPVPELSDHDQTYFYFGWEVVNGGWLIERQSRATSEREFANSGYGNLTDAWENKGTLGYS